MKFNDIQLLVLAVGAVVEFFVLRSLWLAHQSASWNKIRGHVIDSYMDLVPSTDGSSQSSNTYKPRISYRYTYEGVDYTSDQIAYAYAYGPKSWAAKLVSAYSKGKEINVYVQPDKPKRSVLLTGIKPVSAVMLLFIPPLVFMGALMATR